MIKPAVAPGTWAELGCGRGAFTLALAELMGRDGKIIAIDKDAGALNALTRRMATSYPDVAVSFQQANFTKSLNLPALDGLLMANSLHFVRKKGALLKRLHQSLKPKGQLILVEYNADRGNLWVPHPMSFESWQRLASEAGFSTTRKIGARPSSFLGEIYSAVSAK